MKCVLTVLKDSFNNPIEPGDVEDLIFEERQGYTEITVKNVYDANGRRCDRTIQVPTNELRRAVR